LDEVLSILSGNSRVFAMVMSVGLAVAAIGLWFISLLNIWILVYY